MDRVEYCIVSSAKLSPKFVKINNLENKGIAATTTSVSTFVILILRMPCLDISCTCEKACVSAVSCVQYKAAVVLLIADYCFIKSTYNQCTFIKTPLNDGT